MKQFDFDNDSKIEYDNIFSQGDAFSRLFFYLRHYTNNFRNWIINNLNDTET